jgi:LysM domain
MKRPLISLFIILGLISGCAYFQKKDEPPPLPEIVETKPPLSMKGEYFKAYPWAALAKPRKDGNDPDTTTYTFKEGDTLDSVAEKTMGDAGLASGLASYNEISPSSKVDAGAKIVIPNPIIGVSSQIIVKSKGEKEFGAAQSFDTKLKKGDEYKLRFEPNVDGYCYIFREGPKGVEMLYPPQVKVPPTKAQSTARLKKGQKAKAPAKASLMRDTAKVKAHQPIEIPVGKKGFMYDAKDQGDRVFVFLSLREIPDLENLKEKPKLKVDDVETVMHRVKEGEVYSEGPYRLLRINDIAEILGFALNLSG